MKGIIMYKMGSTQRRDNSGGVSVTAHVCSTRLVRWMSSMVNIFSRMRERPSICQTTRKHAASIVLSAICPSRSRSSLQTNQQTLTRNELRTSFLPHDTGDPSCKTCVLSQT